MDFCQLPTVAPLGTPEGQALDELNQLCPVPSATRRALQGGSVVLLLSEFLVFCNNASPQVIWFQTYVTFFFLFSDSGTN